MANQFNPFRRNPFDDEITLVTALRRGDEFAYRFVYEANWPKVRSYVTAGGKGSEDDAKDIYQEAMIILLDKLNRVDVYVKVSTYLFSIAKYKWWAENRRQGRYSQYEADGLYGEKDEQSEPDPLDELDVERDVAPATNGKHGNADEDPEPKAHQPEEGSIETILAGSIWGKSDLPTIDEIVDYIKTMGPPCTELLLDHYFAKVSFEEMAEENQEKPGTIRRRAFDCRERVKKYFMNW